VEIADAVLGHQSRGLLGDDDTIALDAIMGVDTVMFAA
jgi:hypothetical protein